MLLERKKTFFFLIFFLFISLINCQSNNSDEEINYSHHDFSLIGWKKKGLFETEFPESIAAQWGYIKGSEVGVILYETSNVARIEGENAGFEQTQFLSASSVTTEDKGDTGSFFGPKVEKTDCRGFDGKTLFRGECPRREPLYTVYKVDGNAVISLEPLRDENIDATRIRLHKLISELKLKKNEIK